jgi:hypothetical protein
MKKLTTLVILGTIAFGANANAACGDTCNVCPKPSAVCDTCAPTMRMQRMERVCTPCGETCCPKLGFWYNY